MVSIPDLILCVTTITQLHRIGSGLDGCAIAVMEDRIGSRALGMPAGRYRQVTALH